VPNIRGTARPFDRVGFVLSGAAMAGLMYGLDELGRPGANWLMAAVILTVCLALGALAVRHASRHSHPLLDLAPSRIPTMRVNVWSGSLFRIAYNAVPYLMPLLLQVGFGMSAFHAGMLILIGAAGDVSIKPATTPLFRRFGFRRVLICNGVIGAGAILGFTLLGPATPNWMIGASLLCYGVTRSLQFTAQGTLAFADIPPHLTGPASTLISMLMQMTTGMGVAFGAIVLHAVLWLHGNAGGTPMVADFRFGFVASALVTLTSVVGYWRLPKDAGAAISRPRGR
jgi:hypothetical protein